MNFLKRIWNFNFHEHFKHLAECPECGTDDWTDDHPIGDYYHEKTCRYCRHVRRYEVTPY